MVRVSAAAQGRGPGPPRDAPPPGFWALPPAAWLSIPATSAAQDSALCLLGSAGPPCPAWTLTPVLRPVQSPGEPRRRFTGDGGLHECCFFQGSWSRAACWLCPQDGSLCVFSVCCLFREWVSAAGNDSARTGLKAPVLQCSAIFMVQLSYPYMLLLLLLSHFSHVQLCATP